MMNFFKNKIADFLREEIKLYLDSADFREELRAKELQTSVNAELVHADPAYSFYGRYGYAKSTKPLTDAEKQAVYLNFQYKEKAKVALSVASSYAGGHYLEFGSHDLYTFRNFLSAFDVGNLNQRYPDTNFYAFDIFGSYEIDRFNAHITDQRYKKYFDDFTPNGDVIAKYTSLLDDFGLFTDRIHLIKGFFQDTIPEFKLEGKIGFACLDCNIESSYNFVLNYLFDKVDYKTYIYADEYFDNYSVEKEVEKFHHRLIKERNMKLSYVRSAASVGALFRIVSASFD